VNSQLPQQTPEQADKASRRRAALLALAVAVLAIAVHLNTLSAGFVNYDDPKLILNNPYIRGFTWENLRHIWTQPIKEAYLPLRATSYALDYAIWGLEPFGFHLINVLLHAVVSVLVFAIARRLTGSLLAASAAGALFAVHPAHTEAVAWASGRKDVLSTALFLGSYLLYIAYAQGGRRKHWLVRVSVVAFVLSGLAKAMVVTLPVLIILTDYVYGDRLREGRWKRLVPAWGAYIAAAAFVTYLAVHFASSAKAIVPYHFGSGERTALFMTWAVLFYLKTMLWPDFLSARYPFGDTDDFGVPDLAIRMAPAALAIVLAAALLMFLRSRETPRRPTPMWLKMTGLGLAWFFVSLLPVLNIIPINILVADRYLYVPSVGFVLAAAGCLVGLRQWSAEVKGVRAGRAVVAVILGAAIVLASARTWARNRVWQDSISLWGSVVSEFPQSAQARLLLAGAYAETEPPDYDRALAEVDAAERIEPSSGEPHLVRGRIYSRMGDAERAQAELRMARTLGVEGAGDAYELELEQAQHLDAAGDLAGAAAAVERAISLDPSRPEGYNYLGSLAERSGNLARAEELYRLAARADSRSAQAEYNLGRMAVRRRDIPEAAAHYNRAIEIEPDYAEALANLGALYLEAGDVATARPLLERAVALKGDLAPARVSLAVALAMSGDAAGARRELEAALRIDPDSVTVKQMLEKLGTVGQGAG
jgi:tetratricopeptide (TPR) repeat protein